MEINVKKLRYWESQGKNSSSAYDRSKPTV